MNQQGVRWTAEQVLALAPDDASRRAGGRLGTSGSWSAAGSNGTGAVWGLCRASGSRPYRTAVDTTGPACTCSCPSRKSPCKHALGLLLLWAADDDAVRGDDLPEWARQWLEGRRGRATDGEGQGGGEHTGGGPGGGTAGAEAARRRAERRSARITAGAQELEQRLADLLRGGLASADQAGYGQWEETAARMVDAQAPGLAARVRELGAIPGSGPGWPVRLLEECSLTHLLGRAWLGRERLPEPLAATVRTRVGLGAPAEGPAVRDHWSVLARYDTSDGRLTTRRIWLYGRDSRRTALLLSFGAAGRAPQLSLPVGVSVDAEITPHPGAGQLRAELGEQFSPPAPIGSAPPGGSATDALTAYGTALRDDPWLDSWPAVLADVIPVPTRDGGWQLADRDGGLALPITQAALARPGLWRLVALSGGGPVTVFGECGHRGFAPLTAWSADTSETVPLT
ncbi:SWIM zinc finger family protein [Streptomyces sp. SP18CS02]|uniref:SWIM zinc finger family protein n=1 Tax=Streptomyces sp. SP18CS02 TaxID=3002531 RepID=UPI002E7840EB|nr:SWIM zinc finger family protein [Streptomyces sp. SP18CS02]MEE1756109.1 SWIM zinc finger family protein [Streptomyces sp. SP18CS02]